MNHMAHSEAIKAARDTESHLKGEVEQLRASNEKKDNEIRRYVHCLLKFPMIRTDSLFSSVSRSM